MFRECASDARGDFGPSILKDGYGRRAGLRDDAPVAVHSPSTGRLYQARFALHLGRPSARIVQKLILDNVVVNEGRRQLRCNHQFFLIDRADGFVVAKSAGIVDLLDLIVWDQRLAVR